MQRHGPIVLTCCDYVIMIACWPILLHQTTHRYLYLARSLTQWSQPLVPLGTVSVCCTGLGDIAAWPDCAYLLGLSHYDCMLADSSAPNNPPALVSCSKPYPMVATSCAARNSASVPYRTGRCSGMARLCLLVVIFSL